MLTRENVHTLYTPSEVVALKSAAAFRDVERMKIYAPALFTTSPHPSLSERYSFTNTYDIIMSAINRGYVVTSITGGEKKYSKMLIRMRHSAYKGVEGAPELVLRDSHDGSSSLTLLLGYIRFICANGQIVSDNIYARSFMHIAPDLHAQVLLELDDIMVHMERLEQSVVRMKNRSTNIGERIAIADAATEARFGTKIDGTTRVELRQKLLERRRPADNENDLFTIMNIVQENAMRGGMSYQTRHRMQRMSSIRSVDRNVQINQRIWHAANSLLAA